MHRLSRSLLAAAAIAAVAAAVTTTGAGGAPSSSPATAADDGRGATAAADGPGPAGPGAMAMPAAGTVGALRAPAPPPATRLVTTPLPARLPTGLAVAARREPAAVTPLPTSTSPEGWTVAGGTSTDPVAGGGRVVRWTLEVEPATGLDVEAVLGTVEGALYDARSWARDHDLRRVADPALADVRVIVARPATVDALCARAGLDTIGRYSCWNGRIAAINLDRWVGATPEFTDLGVYRAYVVNHEVGHGLGRGHVTCRAAGARADVMQQQTKSLAGCTANPWPYPDA